MQCTNLLKKRSLQPETWTRAKRMCLEAELQAKDCPMEMTNTVTNVGDTEQVRSKPAQLCCPRCLGGEPGHINHIMGN